MLMQFDEPLQEQQFWACGTELCTMLGRDRDAAGGRQRDLPDDVRECVATLRDPLLVTDLARIARMEPRVRDTVAKLLETPRRVTRYGGVELAFEQRRWPTVWGPNIDTLLMCRALGREDLSQVRDVVEVGCGSGFISLFLLARVPSLRSVTLLDIDPGAVACAQESVVDPRARAEVADGRVWLRGRRVDLVVCNPPYIPRPASLGGNAYEGVDLLVHFIREAPSFLSDGGRVLVNVSSLAMPVLAPLLGGVPWRVLDRLEVPLKVLNVLNNREWMEWLVFHKGLTLRTRDGYDAWHTVDIVELHG